MINHILDSCLLLTIVLALILMVLAKPWED